MATKKSDVVIASGNFTAQPAVGSGGDAKPADISTPCALYNEQEILRRLPRSLMGGTRKMREARTDYLPQEEGESDPAYQARLDRSFLYNGFARTVYASTGKVLDRPIKVNGPPAIDPWMKNITMDGRNIDQFAAKLFSTVLAEGIGFIQVEFPRVTEGTTAEDDKRRRPYLIEVAPQDLIWWNWTMVGGVPEMTEVRIRERHYNDDGTMVEQIRVLKPGQWEIHRSLDGEFVLVDSGPSSLTKVPIVPVYGKRLGVFQGEPPLRDLADLNLMHWQSSSDQRHILHIARVPILFAAGWGEDSDRIIVGPNRLIKSPNPSASLHFVEHSGAAIGAGSQDILEIETRMAAMGLELISTAAPGDMTATQKVIEKTETESALQIMAVDLQNGLSTAISFMAEYAGVSGEVSADVNTAFEVAPFESQETVALFDLRMTGDLSRETLFKELIRRGLFAPDFEYDDELKRIEKEGPPPGKFGEPELDEEGNPIAQPVIKKKQRVVIAAPRGVKTPPEETPSVEEEEEEA